MKIVEKIKADLQVDSQPEKIAIYKWFFKTGKGEYAEGDDFLGITVPNQRKIAKKYKDEVNLKDIDELLNGKYHEYRLTGLYLLIHKFEEIFKKIKKQQNWSEYDKKEAYNIVQFYLKHLEQNHINNWDLVDTSAHKILGRYLFEFGEDRSILITLTHGHLWQQRASMIATFWFIKEEDFDWSFEIAKLLVTHPHDLIHKAVGWGLREIGNRNLLAEEWFLKEEDRYKTMPRTMLRYAIEKFPKERREKYLKGLI